MDGAFICGAKVEQLKTMAAGRVAQWPRGYVVRWGVSQGVSQFNALEMTDIVRTAFDAWAAVCGFRHALSTNSAAWNVEVLSRRIDGQFGTLAEAQLPVDERIQTSPERFRLYQWYDTSEAWTLAAGNTGQLVDILRTAVHETGHTIGLGHAPAGSENLMAPQLGPYRTPQDYGQREGLRRYGDPVVEPPGGGGGPGGGGPGGEPNLCDLVLEIAERFARERGIRPAVPETPKLVKSAAQLLAESDLGSAELNNAAGIIRAHLFEK